MPPIFQRFRKVLSRRGKRAPFSVEPKESIWKRLPDHVLVRLVSLCELNDIISLALTCRLLHRRVFHNEIAISHSFINLRRKGDQEPADCFDRSPGDDLTFISELFPPPPPQYAVGDGHVDADYSFAYLVDLKRCWTTCIQLSYHLADHAVRYHLDTDPIAQPLWTSSKTEKEVVYSKAVAALHVRLLYPMAYAILFLESCVVDGSDSDSSIHLANIFKLTDDQQSILQDVPFTSSHILISTQHCLELLCSTVRRLMHPEFPSSTSESWVSLLLMTSTLERILQFFVSVAKDEEKGHSSSHTTSWSHRKEFMWRMREDLGHYVAASNHDPNQTFTEPPGLDKVWFEACRQELFRRGAIPHTAEEPVPVLHGSSVALTCKYCDIEE
ncbi:hypothetical protein N7478_001648 [Penicillium angulare]|uniref:uncharacterized protein n=1 Tax=Penicillium angulare TaxID=116970 RepID=UPI002540FC4B|nr:uncharacterized protein N7478_001648 [Penicillium angulare]KAJ5288618.1 hypothetical protein N7478_001648 [Penicillium angulare]